MSTSDIGAVDFHSRADVNSGNRDSLPINEKNTSCIR